MSTLTKVLLKQKTNQVKFFSRPQFYAKKIKKILQPSLKKTEVFLFGSLLQKRATPQSDIDILIFSPFVPKEQFKKAKILGLINKAFGFFHPFEIHLVDKKGLDWYRRFSKLKRI